MIFAIEHMLNNLSTTILITTAILVRTRNVCYWFTNWYAPFTATSQFCDTIYFYNRNDPYYEFTNFAMYKVRIDDKTWPTSEHYFQAQKFVGTPYEEAIRKLTTPREAFDFSRKPQVHGWRRNDWEVVKEDVMKKALLAKFTQHSDLHLMLLDTRNLELVEHTSNDNYWGDGGDGNGQNRLGYLLMSVREELRWLSTSKSHQSPDVQIVKMTTKVKGESSPVNETSSPLNSNKCGNDLISFPDDELQSDGSHLITESTCDSIQESDNSSFDPISIIPSENSSNTSEGLLSLGQNPFCNPVASIDLNTKDTSNSQDTFNSREMGPQPMEEGNSNPAGNTLQTEDSQITSNVESEPMDEGNP